MDYAFQGEAEIGLPKLLDAIKNKKGFEGIPGLI